MNKANQQNIILLGDERVGKTSILKWLVSGEFNRDHNTTVGVDFVSLPLTTRDGV